MNKFLCSFIFIGFIGAISAATETTSSTTTQPPKKESVPQTSYVPSATNYQSSSNSEAAILNNQAYDPTLYQTFVPQDAVQQYVSQYGGYAGQALEGFLIPTFDRNDYVHDSTPTFVALLKSFLPGPKIIFAILAKIVALLASAIGVVFFGGAITSFVCAFTPLCTITFLGRPLALIKKETKDLVEKIGEEFTADRVKRAADLLKLAYDKYNAMQAKQ